MNSVSRFHTDVDFAILRKDQSAVLSQFIAAGWSTATAHQGNLTPCIANQTLALPIHCIWCTKESATPPFVELLLNESENGEFVYRRCSKVRLPLDQTFINSKLGIPILAPEIVLLYKSKDHLAPRNDHDFARAVGTLDQTPLNWLREALRITTPAHPWLDRL
nr:amino acid transporter [Schlesneria paludicola]